MCKNKVFPLKIIAFEQKTVLGTARILQNTSKRGVSPMKMIALKQKSEVLGTWRKSTKMWQT
jgi:hypothetical protein